MIEPNLGGLLSVAQCLAGALALITDIGVTAQLHVHLRCMDLVASRIRYWIFLCE